MKNLILSLILLGLVACSQSNTSVQPSPANPAQQSIVTNVQGTLVTVNCAFNGVQLTGQALKTADNQILANVTQFCTVMPSH